MQIGIAGYCVMLAFDFILRFREEVRPFMPILRVCMGKCRIFLALEIPIHGTQTRLHDRLNQRMKKLTTSFIQCVSPSFSRYASFSSSGNIGGLPKRHL